MTMAFLSILGCFISPFCCRKCGSIQSYYYMTFEFGIQVDWWGAHTHTHTLPHIHTLGPTFIDGQRVKQRAVSKVLKLISTKANLIPWQNNFANLIPWARSSVQTWVGQRNAPTHHTIALVHAWQNFACCPSIRASHLYSGHETQYLFLWN